MSMQIHFFSVVPFESFALILFTFERPFYIIIYAFETRSISILEFTKESLNIYFI